MCVTAAALHVGIWGQHNTWNEYIYIYICIYIIYIYIIIYILFIHTLSAQHSIWNIYIFTNSENALIRSKQSLIRI